MTADANRQLWSRQLDDGLAAMAIAADARQRERLIDYLALLVKWNRAFNLTAVRDLRQMVSRQLLDSLSILPWLQGPRVLDVGTGAGLPGIPLAILNPGISFTLLDTNGKKTRFVNQVRMELGLENVEVINTRVEAYHPAASFDCITTRAFATLADMVQGTHHLLAEGGCWLAMKGAVSDDELAALPPDIDCKTMALRVPGETGQRHAVIMRTPSP